MLPQYICQNIKCEKSKIILVSMAIESGMKASIELFIIHLSNLELKLKYLPSDKVFFHEPHNLVREASQGPLP